MSTAKNRWVEVHVADDVLRDHMRQGGFGLTRWKLALLGDEELRLMKAEEPAGINGNYIRHVSVSVGKVGDVGTSRRPTDDEIELVRKSFPTIELQEECSGEFVRHLWEKEKQT